MTDTLQNYFQYMPYLIGYVFFYLISDRLIEYLVSLGKNASDGQKALYKKFVENYSKQAYKSWKEYKDTVADLGKERSYHTNLLVISGILLVVNAFVLSAFLDSIGNLSAPIIIDPIRINYSHLIAASIVLVEIATGIVFYIGHSSQMSNQDNPIYATLKFFALMAFISLLVVEVLMWVRLSVLFNMADLLGISENNVFRDAIDYFLGALGIGFTMTEFAMGYFLTKYTQFGQNSFVSNFGRYFLVSFIFILIYYVPYIVLIPLSYFCTISVQIIKLLIIPGDAIFEKFNKN